MEIKKCIEHTCKVRYGTSVYRIGHVKKKYLWRYFHLCLIFISFHTMQKSKDHETYNICFQRVINTSLSISSDNSSHVY